MNDTIFVLGNGPSRKNIDPKLLPGLVIGCNACYRDFKPDAICAIDAGIISDIIDSGFDGDCYFTHDSWNLLSEKAYDPLANGTEHTTYRRFDSEYFVYISGLDSGLEKYQQQGYIIWVPKKMEHKIKNIGIQVLGWSTGTSAVYVACMELDPKKVYILGFDHKNDEYDNLYADTKHYYSKDSKQEWKTIHSQWSDQLFQVFNWFPNIEFYWVNYGGYVFSDGAFQKNLHFIDGDTKWHH
jgi:hypothetical protein